MEPMDFRILYVVFATVITSYTQSCLIDTDTSCIYTVTCIDNIHHYFDWNRFRDYSSQSAYTCQPTVDYNGYLIYPVKLIFKQTVPDYSQPVPPGSNILNLLQYLDLTDNAYDQTPNINNMQNLKTLNISRNLLTTAVLSNNMKLNELVELDLSYNTISDIKVNVNRYIYKTLLKINLSHNYLIKISDAIFDQFSDLEVLDLSYNYIDTLDQFTFEGIRKLTNLDLSNNKLTDINSSLFRFSELEILNLSGNRITDIKWLDFVQLHKLVTLDLNSNIINTIDVNVFNQTTLLEGLDLSNNQLEIIEMNTFAGLKTLKQIDLSKNQLTRLPIGLFKNTSLSYISITENKLAGLLERGMFEGCNVAVLDLSNQHFTEIKDYGFYNLDRLTTLFLNSNNIYSLSNMSFATLINLQLLDLSDNEITSIDFKKDNLKDLQSLILRNNHLTVIQQKYFDWLSSLEFIDISGNLITQIEPNSFKTQYNLINLKISSNPLVGTLEAGTFEGLESLPILDISNNMLTTIRNNSFKNMFKLTVLTMSAGEISELEYNTFFQTGYIETIDLSYNKLKVFFVNTTELVALSTLLLNNNLIKTISPPSIKGLSQLTKLTLSYNILENISNETFMSLLDLRFLDLSYNENLNFSAAILKNNHNLHTLNISGIKSHIKFAHIGNESTITDLAISNAQIGNIHELSLSMVARLDTLDLSHNNVSKLQIEDFTGIRTIRCLDLSYNQIYSIQPGSFKDNTELHSLNISHNSLSFIGYGIFRGLNYLSILDLSYNNIKDLQSERFYEVKSLSQLIVDYNKIDSINAEEFVGTSLSKLSIGDNPLPCRTLVKLRGVPFHITAIKLDEHSNENVEGVTCNKAHTPEIKTISNQVVYNNSDVIDGLRNLLNNVTYKNIIPESVNTEYLKKISNILETSNLIYEEKLSELVNLTSAVGKNNSLMISKIIQLFSQSPVIKHTLSPVTQTTPIATTNLMTPITQPIDAVAYLNKVKEEIENAMTIQKQSIMNEIENKFALKNYETQPTTNVGQEKLVLENETTKSLFTETCVALILFILVGLVLYKFYKSRMFVRNRFSFSTRELPGAMENSAL